MEERIGALCIRIKTNPTREIELWLDDNDEIYIEYSERHCEWTNETTKLITMKDLFEMLKG